MKTSLAFLLSIHPILFGAQLEWIPDEAPQIIFSGEARKIQVILRNPTVQTIEVRCRTRLFQASSATAMPLGEAQPWKKLQVPASQTIVESAPVTFPAVRVGTRFLVQWLDEQDRVLGPTEVMVYPPGLLKELKVLAGEQALGVFDPQDKIKPLLKQSRVDFEDLDSLENFRGRLAIIGPFTTPERAPADFGRRIKAVARAGRAVIWIQTPTRLSPGPPLPVCLIREGAGAVVVAQAKAFSDLVENPQAQLSLVRLAALALKPEQWELTLLKP